MHPIRPIAHSLHRTRIDELANLLLRPQTCLARSSSHIPLHCSSRSRPIVLFRRHLSTTPTTLSKPSHKPKTHDRGPPSKEETQTDFGVMNVLGNTPPPSTSIDACLWDGFHLNSGAKVTGGSGVLLVAGEAFSWKPWEASSTSEIENKRLVNEKGQWEVVDEAWGLLGLVWPKPDLLIIGLGKDMMPISSKTRQYVNSLGIRIDILDTRNAAAQFNLLATERGVGSVAAALIPLGWREGIGVK